jgi:hypothetical protein
MTRYDQILDGLPEDLTEADLVIDRSTLDIDCTTQLLTGLLLELFITRGARSVVLHQVSDDERVTYTEWALMNGVADRLYFFDPDTDRGITAADDAGK